MSDRNAHIETLHVGNEITVEGVRIDTPAAGSSAPVQTRRGWVEVVRRADGPNGELILSATVVADAADDRLPVDDVAHWTWDSDGTLTTGTTIPRFDFDALRSALLVQLNAAWPDGHPMKFTAEDVALLRRSFDLSNDVWRTSGEERAASLVARIAALLPPETP